jgi:hypothetical protein
LVGVGRSWLLCSVSLDEIRFLGERSIAGEQQKAPTAFAEWGG